ncbi:MAG TPA: hypothetical protein VFU15_12395 [Bacteroidia bacterium]|nr:hypothetical protein [Bacteroidia bacterium]
MKTYIAKSMLSIFAVLLFTSVYAGDPVACPGQSHSSRTHNGTVAHHPQQRKRSDYHPQRKLQTKGKSYRRHRR